MISITNLSLRRGPRLLLEAANALINRGDRVGLVGDNGCGKTSLFAMILGELGADVGSLTVQEGAVIAHVSQQTPSSEQSALDYVLDGDQALRDVERKLASIDHEKDGTLAATWYERMEQIDGYSAPARAAQLMHGLGFTTEQLDNPTRSFSGGWRVRMNLAQALMCPSDLLLLDEPTNHLDLDAVVWLEEWLLNYRGTLVMISHDRDFLDAICKRILHIEHNTIRTYGGNYSRFEVTRAEKLASEQSAMLKQQRAISHMEDYVRRFRAQATKARQAQSRLKALERMQVIAPAHVHSPFTFSFYQPPQASDPLVRLDGVSCGYGETTVLSDINLSIRSTDRLALVGHNGAGKSTFVKLLAGELPAMTGEIVSAKNLQIGYFAQHQLEQLDGRQTPMEQFGIQYPKVRHQEIRSFLGRFGFRDQRIEEKIAPFSGGEKARLALALLIFGKPNLLLMDEPTNHLDLEMRHALTMAFQNYDGAIVLVSHDRHLIRTVSDQLWLVDGGRAMEFDDDIEGYQRWTRQQKLSEGQQKTEKKKSAKSGSNRKEQRQRSAQLRQQVQPLNNRIRRIDREMEDLRGKSAKLEDVLADPNIYEQRSTAELAKLMKDKAKIENKIADAEASWLEVSEELEAVQLQLGSG